MDDLKISAFTGRNDDPASFFRMRQHFPALKGMGLDIREFKHPCFKGCWHRGPFKIVPYLPKLIKSRDCDVTWITRTLVVGLETIELLLKRPRVMDVDDATWLSKPLGSISIPHLAKRMDVIIAGNNYIADWFSKYCKNIHIVPTSIDTTRYTKKKQNADNDKFVIGWTGTSSNFSNLKLIEETLARFCTEHKDAYFKIIADEPWHSELISPERIEFVKWSREVEVKALQTMTVGIMPLFDTPWTRGKCSFKMLQYMAVGLPIIVSPVGMNNEVLAKGDIGFAATSSDEWYNALETLYKDKKLQKKSGEKGREVVEHNFSAEAIASKLFSILSNAAL
ncbi:MAG: glycosyltransferase family 4 protein [Sedimentisphaerales bacterium]|nr:glycosyltransferase family 4 protein [Sedimentisphaerales bacterium]